MEINPIEGEKKSHERKEQSEQLIIAEASILSDRVWSWEIAKGGDDENERASSLCEGCQSFCFLAFNKLRHFKTQQQRREQKGLKVKRG